MKWKTLRGKLEKKESWKGKGGVESFRNYKGFSIIFPRILDVI